MRRTSVAILVAVLFLHPGRSTAQIYPPAPGVEMPRAYHDRLAHDRDAFRFRRAWIEKAERARVARERVLHERGFYNPKFLSSVDAAQFAVAGTVRVPVFMVTFANTVSPPYATSFLQTKLFDGPYSPQTLSEMYDEMSYGDLDLTGTVYGWTALANNDTYYEGGCQGLCDPGAKIGELIVETLNANDAGVDFGQYDNDGPDGLPNSGDDDGYVDFAAFVHPEVGGECGTPNIWSHRYFLEGWSTPGAAGWTSNDPRTGGGFIKVSDYVIQPALNCGGTTGIDIGVFCHEFGHAFGLPDLYDTNNGSEGIGHWGLMGSGSWNSTTKPAHMCAWSKSQLGWVDIVDVDGVSAPYAVDNVEFNRTVYRLGVMEERWRRLTECPIAGSYSMWCGLKATEATARSWTGGKGYGNGWDERVMHDFHYDGAGSVTLEYDYQYESEPGYDYTYGRIDVGGVVSTFATYNGTGSGHATIDLSPYLTAPADYTVFFEFTSDIAWSDEDNLNPTTCGAFAFDDVSLVGGGESHSTGFEVREDGWHCDMTDPNEKYLVENRQALGSDANVHGGGGLAIWHIDESITRGSGNTGGSTGALPHGVDLVQADALDDLGNDVNRGDDGDPYPGSTSNSLLDNVTSPDSKSYNGLVTNVVVDLTSGNGDPITANMSGGWFPPVYASNIPVSGDNDQQIAVEIDGSGFAWGVGTKLVQGATIIDAASIEWQGKDRIIATFDLNGAPGGDYDLVLVNPINASSVEPAAFTVNDVVSGVESAMPQSFRLGQNFPNPFNPTTVIPFDVTTRVRTTLRIYDARGAVVRTLVDEVLPPQSYTRNWDGTNDDGHRVSSGVYFYKLTAGHFQDVRKLVLAK